MTAIAETLRRSKGKRLLILSDSKAAIAAVVKAGRRGRGRTRELRDNGPHSKKMWKRPYGGLPELGKKPHWD